MRTSSSMNRIVMTMLWFSFAACGRVLDLGEGADGGQACVLACGVGCQAPGTVCYSDGHDYCSDCAAACARATRVTCSDAGVPPSGPKAVTISTLTYEVTWGADPLATSYNVYLRTVHKELGLTTTDERIVRKTDPKTEQTALSFSVASFNACRTAYFIGVSAVNAYGESEIVSVGYGPSVQTCDLAACTQACGIGCQAPGAVCYSDGRDYCSDCVAACSGAARVACLPLGTATVEGTVALKPIQVRARPFFALQTDGGLLLNRIMVGISTVDYSCANFQTGLAGPGDVLAFDGIASGGTELMTGTTFTSDFDTAYVEHLNPDGGNILGFDRLGGTFSFDFDKLPATDSGVRGQFDVIARDGGTLRGKFNATVCR